MLFIQKYLLPGLGSSILFLLADEITRRIRKERTSRFHRGIVLAAGLYLAGLFTMKVSRGFSISWPRVGEIINWNPFQAFRMVLSSPQNFWENVFLFFPLGVFLVLLFYQCRRLSVTLFIGAGISFLIELLQLFNVQTTDIADVILNTAGTLLGYLIGRALLSFVPHLRDKVGICQKMNGKVIRKHRDAGNFAALVFLVLFCVLLTGYIKPQGTKLRSLGTALEISAKNAYLWNANSNTVLFEKESDAQIAPASTAKMLTALTVLDHCREDDTVLVGQEVKLIPKDASRAWLNPGNKLTVRQLLDALLLPSGNDAAYALAVFTGRDILKDGDASIEDAIAAFVDAMNEKAADIDALHTHFVNPDGYDADGQYTTARDLALIANTFLKTDTLKEIAGSHRISDVWLSGQDVTYDNTNELINPESPYYYECANGLKTGSSGDAGCCLVSCAYINDETYICVVMGSTEEGRWQDSLALYRAIQE